MSTPAISLEVFARQLAESQPAKHDDWTVDRDAEAQQPCSTAEEEDIGMYKTQCVACTYGLVTCIGGKPGSEHVGEPCVSCRLSGRKCAWSIDVGIREWESTKLRHRRGGSSAPGKANASARQRRTERWDLITDRSGSALVVTGTEGTKYFLDTRGNRLPTSDCMAAFSDS